LNCGASVSGDWISGVERATGDAVAVRVGVAVGAVVGVAVEVGLGECVGTGNAATVVDGVDVDVGAEVATMPRFGVGDDVVVGV